MSGIFGIFKLNNEPVTDEELTVMENGMRHWGPDGRSHLTAGYVGLGHLLLHNTPEAHLENLPRQTTSGLLLTAEARLDNRAELCHHFNILPSEQPQVPDSRLIELAYDTWGEACPDHLLGDFAFAVWNPQNESLFIARDHHGNTSLYYYQDANRFIFASSREALLAFGVPRRLNELYLAQVLVSWPAYHGERSIDLDIYRLPPAHAMRITAAHKTVWQYWRLEDTPELRLPNFEDYVAHFLEVYSDAVNCRLRSSKPIGVTLSGGLDSGSVAALAAKTLHRQGKRLTAYTSAPLHDVQNTVGPYRFGDETGFAKETAVFHPNIDHHLLNASQITPIEGIRQVLAIRNEPGHAGANFYWIADILQVAQQQGIGTLLTGQGGNASISWTGAPELASSWAMYQKQGWKAGLKLFMPFSMLRALRRRRLTQDTFAGSAIHLDFARRMNLAERQISAIGRDNSMVESYRSARQKRYGIIKPGASLLTAIWAELGAGYRMEIRDPTLDKRVLMATIAVPDRFFAGPNGEDRWLIRAAMDGLLPDVVRLNRKRGRQAADLGQRLSNASNEVNQVLANLQASEACSYIDLAKLQAVWADIQQEKSKDTTRKAGSILMRGLNAGMFFL